MQVSVPYEEAIKRKYPEQVVIAVAKDAEGKFNPITLGWTMITSHDPPMMAVSVGRTRHSLAAIREAGEFVIAFPSSEMGDEALYFGTHSGADEDKLSRHPTPTEPADEVDGVLLGDAVANFECVLEGEMETGDHVIFAGRVVASHLNREETPGRLYTLGPGYEMGGVRPA